MIQLPIEKYNLLIEPLKMVSINNLFARAVIEKHVSGKVLVDNIDKPKTFYIIHPYGISLLFGDHTNRNFNDAFCNYALNIEKNRSKFEWMQASPREWDRVLKDLLGDKLIKESENIDKIEFRIVEINTRVNFKFNKDKYRNAKMGSMQPDDLIVRTGFKEFVNMTGSVIPQYFWDNADDFVMNGVGFSLIYNGQIASTAYSAFVQEEKLEIGIETTEKYRGLGFAEKTCSRLIEYCLERNLEPIWSCRLENTASYQLAQKLGFEPTIMIPFYRLSK
jgi:GNAT superfamily N-acetyltransferase